MVDKCDIEIVNIADSNPTVWIVHFGVWKLAFVYYCAARLYLKWKIPVSSNQVYAFRCHKWGVSLVHAFATSVLGAIFIVANNWTSENTPTCVSSCDVVMHLCGYFVADIIGDFEWAYLPHHVVPPVLVEYYIRHHDPLVTFHHHDGLARLAVVATWLEAGNAITHGAALWPTLARLSPRRENEMSWYIWMVRLVAFVVSRAAAFTLAWAVWEEDFPRSGYGFFWDRALFLAGFHVLLWSNVYWAYKLLRGGPANVFSV